MQLMKYPIGYVAAGALSLGLLAGCDRKNAYTPMPRRPASAVMQQQEPSLPEAALGAMKSTSPGFTWSGDRLKYALDLNWLAKKADDEKQAMYPNNMAIRLAPLHWSGEYAHIEIPYAGGSFTFECDVKPKKTAGMGISVGLSDSDVYAPACTSYLAVTREGTRFQDVAILNKVYVFVGNKPAAFVHDRSGAAKCSESPLLGDGMAPERWGDWHIRIDYDKPTGKVSATFRSWDASFGDVEFGALDRIFIGGSRIFPLGAGSCAEGEVCNIKFRNK